MNAVDCSGDLKTPCGRMGKMFVQVCALYIKTNEFWIVWPSHEDNAVCPRQRYVTFGPKRNIGEQIFKILELQAGGNDPSERSIRMRQTPTYSYGRLSSQAAHLRTTNV